MDEECINCRVPTFGEFVPRLRISATFGEKSGDLTSLGIFLVLLHMWDSTGKRCGQKFPSDVKMSYFDLLVSSKILAIPTVCKRV